MIKVSKLGYDQLAYKYENMKWYFGHQIRHTKTHAHTHKERERPLAAFVVNCIYTNIGTVSFGLHILIEKDIKFIFHQFIYFF